jgi:hypothetical protein
MRDIGRFGVVLTLAVLAGCTPKAAPKVDFCAKPAMAATQPAGTFQGASERATICVKLAAYDADRAGGPVEAAAQAAMARCAPQEAAELAALARTQKVYGWEKDQIHEKLQHLALLSARQDRARGCGRAGGGGPETD